MIYTDAAGSTIPPRIYPRLVRSAGRNARRPTYTNSRTRARTHAQHIYRSWRHALTAGRNVIVLAALSGVDGVHR